jgi:hypothetical protein
MAEDDPSNKIDLQNSNQFQLAYIGEMVGVTSGSGLGIADPPAACGEAGW